MPITMNVKAHLILLLSFFHLTIASNDSLLVAVLMVKNEANCMQTTLEPLIKAGITSYVIFDTGSTDDTICITKQIFEQYGITNFFIPQEPFIDFATSRNRALELTQQYFPNASFMLMLDSEWHLHNGEKLLQFCQQQKNIPIPLYLIKMKQYSQEFQVARLIKCHSNIRFVGKVHEVPNQATYFSTPDTVYFTYQPSEYGHLKSCQRWLKDRDILLKEFEENPDNPRTVFYLARAYDCLNDLQNAAKWYLHRTDMQGWDEENFIACYSLAQIYQALQNHDQAILHYLKAFAMRPKRAEPLIQLAKYYWDIDQFELCFLFAQRSLQIPYPTHDILFVDRAMYDYVRYDMVSRSAWYAGEYQLGKQATLIALKANPQAPHLHYNLKLYEEQLIIKQTKKQIDL